MKTGHSLVAHLRRKLGQPYDLHVHVPLEDPTYRGPWNCSTFVAWGLYQAGDRRYFGCRFDKPPGYKKENYRPNGYRGRWAWTGWFYIDLEWHGRQIAERQAIRTAGAIGLYRSHEKDGHPIGHIAVSLGDGHIIEAHGALHADGGENHYGPDPGVISYRTMAGRFLHWYLLPGFSYS